MSKYNRGQTQEEKEAMATSGTKKVEKAKKVETKERAPVSRERRLALALRAVLDEWPTDSPSAAVIDADEVLKSLGYETLVGIPKRIAELESQLHAAVGAGDYSTVAKLGQELDRVKAGKFPKDTLNGSPVSE